MFGILKGVKDSKVWHSLTWSVSTWQSLVDLLRLRNSDLLRFKMVPSLSLRQHIKRKHYAFRKYLEVNNGFKATMQQKNTYTMCKFPWPVSSLIWILLRCWWLLESRTSTSSLFCSMALPFLLFKTTRIMMWHSYLSWFIHPLCCSMRKLGGWETNSWLESIG